MGKFLKQSGQQHADEQLFGNMKAETEARMWQVSLLHQPMLRVWEFKQDSTALESGRVKVSWGPMRSAQSFRDQCGQCSFTKIQLDDLIKLEMGKTLKFLKSHCWELEHQPQPLHLIPPAGSVNCYFLSSSLHWRGFFSPSWKPSNLKPFADLASVSFGVIPVLHLCCLNVVSKTVCKLLQIPSAPRNTAMNTKPRAEVFEE